MAFDPLTWVQEELVPLARALCELVESEGAADQRRFFVGVLAGLENASAPEDLADSFMLLSTSAFQGFHFSAPAALLLDQLLERSQQLSELLSIDDSERH